MNKTVLVFLVLITWQVSAQKHKILPGNINQPTYSAVYPAVSGDGKIMLFLSDYTDDGSFTMMMSRYRSGKWQNPENVKGLGSASVNNWGGYSLNYDGSEIYFSSRRSDGVGKFDIWYSKKLNGKWSRPSNLGKPVNSSGNEANPSFTADKQRIYFMRCETMSTSNAKGCKLFYSHKGPKGWREAVELPEHINVGNTTSPRILPDNKTLTFASDRPGGKGGIDIWMTKRTGEHWSEPINVSVVNTAEDDLFFTSSMRSVAYFTTTSEKGKQVIAEVRLPEQFRLENVIIKQGVIKDEEGNPLAGDVRIYNLDEQSFEGRVKTTSDDGGFIIILPEGTRYDISYNEVKVRKLYEVELVDATKMISSRREYPNIILLDLVDGVNFPLKILGFKPFTSDIEEYSSMEISRLAKLLKNNPQLNIEIGAYQKTYIEEPEKLSDDLTELIVDSLLVYQPAIRIDTLANEQKDSLLIYINEILAGTLEDTIQAYTYLDRMGAIDSVEVLQLTSTYHNDRTSAQASAVQLSLTAKGIDQSRLQYLGHKDDKPPVDFPPDKDRLIVIRLIIDPQD